MMTKSRRFFWTVVFAVVATLAFADASGSPLAKGPVQVTAKFLRWNDPDAEKQWEAFVQTSKRLSLEPRMKNVDTTQAEGQLEAFGTRYMPNAYAQYQEVRAKALEFEQMVKESFPQGKKSDTTGGTMFEKANKKLAEAVAHTFRRRDELCFFLLFHQAGIFSDDELAEYDSSPISIHLETESDGWPDDTPRADTALSAEDSTFAAKYLPETHAGYERLCGLFDEGAKQYADLRRTALALGAPRARVDLLMLKTRLEEIHSTLQQHKQEISMQRLQHAFEETTAEQLAALDQKTAVKIQEYEQTMAIKNYVERTAVSMTGVVKLPGGATMEMVWCPPGTFTMGSSQGDDDEKPHQVTLTKGFWMAKTEVTQMQWNSVMGNNSSPFKGDNLPVEYVSWFDAQKFCKRTGLQLPTEAQWEYACRAGTTGPYAGTGDLDDMGWYDRNSGNRTHPVGTKQPNAWGLYDMHGNVWEWCQDGDEVYKRKRGGSCNSGARSCASFIRTHSPAGAKDNYFGNHFGFRLVGTLSE